ncbi:hypothetical protein [Micromonospora lutea]|uniref:Uncharacterized protein n=1 Tax=Micromonospora lutea TaxID=419825 RepID=A0ABQ4IRS0_9ACTN|nr:hypothetical protein [Micromonospora lutea]GIJ20590.1 hypothetical protein Vlu01_12140 [Micromonospora lutea]
MSRRTGKPSYLVAPPARQTRARAQMVAAAAAAVLVAALVGGLVGHAVGRPDPIEESVAQIRQADAERDAQQIVELTEMAHRTGEELAPIIRGIRDAEAGRTPEQAQLDQWQQTMRRLTAQFADPPSGMTATNVARGGLRSAVDQATVAVDTVALALAKPTTGRTELMSLATRQATLAVTTWSVAATQLDQINVDAGQGHQHVHLDVGEVEGALGPDGSAEGVGG